jgi:hypothetical protein
MCIVFDPKYFNPLNAELNPICHLLALLGAHHILHVSRLKVKRKPEDGPAPKHVDFYLSY